MGKLLDWILLSMGITPPKPRPKGAPKRDGPTSRPAGSVKLVRVEPERVEPERVEPEEQSGRAGGKAGATGQTADGDR
ncbi:MAG: hypothetical protein AAFR38_14110 [Planctomycetota bacterium]